MARLKECQGCGRRTLASRDRCQRCVRMGRDDAPARESRSGGYKHVREAFLESRIAAYRKMDTAGKLIRYIHATREEMA